MIDICPWPNVEGFLTAKPIAPYYDVAVMLDQEFQYFKDHQDELVGKFSSRARTGRRHQKKIAA